MARTVQFQSGELATISPATVPVKAGHPEKRAQLLMRKGFLAYSAFLTLEDVDAVIAALTDVRKSLV